MGSLKVGSGTKMRIHIFKISYSEQRRKGKGSLSRRKMEEYDKKFA